MANAHCTTTAKVAVVPVLLCATCSDGRAMTVVTVTTTTTTIGGGGSSSGGGGVGDDDRQRYH